MYITYYFFFNEHIILNLCFIANNIYKYYSFELLKTIFIINLFKKKQVFFVSR